MSPLRRSIPLLLLAGLAPAQTGIYRLAPDTGLEVARGEAGWTARFPEGAPFALEQVRAGRFAIPGLEARLSIDEGGEAVLERYRETARGSASGAAAPAGLAEAVQRFAPAWMARFNVPGLSLAFLEGGRIAWHMQLGVQAAPSGARVEPHSVFEAASMSKPLFAWAVLRLAEQGALDLEKPLDRYLPASYLPGQEWSGLVTARMVLTHTTGLPNWRPGGWLSGGALAFQSRPGAAFTYSGEGFTWLMAAVEALTGEPFALFTRTRLLDPLGMRMSSYVWEPRFERDYARGHDAAGRPKGRPHYARGNPAFSLYTTPIEYGRFLLAMLGREVPEPFGLSPATLRRMLEPVSRREEGVYFGLGWSIRGGPGGHVFHGGSNGSGFRCMCRFYPGTGRGMVIMTNSDSGAEVYRRILGLAWPEARL